MIVRLHNLSARTLKPADVDAVAALMTACDMFEIGNTDEDGRRRELQETWQVPGFDLSRDAWVIVQKQGLIVGYGDIRDIGEGSFEVYVCASGVSWTWYWDIIIALNRGACA